MIYPVRYLYFYFAILPLLLQMSCAEKTKEKYVLEIIPPEHSGITFSNDLSESEDLNILTFEYFYNGAGVGIGDISNDGHQDIFFSANMSKNRLYVNKGNFVFEDITEKAGFLSTNKWAAGVSMVDINQDGWLDIYVCYAGPYSDPQQRANELYINNGDQTFSEQAKRYGLADTRHTVQAAFFDYDKDGDQDVYLLTNTTDETGPNVIRPKRLKGEMINTDRLYRNNGDETFTDVSQHAGITVEGYGLGVTITDINQDNWLDIFVSNDYLSNDLLYINNRNGTFTDRAAESFKHTSYSAMGNDVADINNDALPDIVSVDMLPPDNTRQKLMLGATSYDRYRSEIQFGYLPQFIRNTLQFNRGLSDDSTVIFSEIGQQAGIHATDWSWSALLPDLDNDGWKDLIITNGYPRDITNRDFASYKANEFMRNGLNEPTLKKLKHALSSLEGAHLHDFVFKNNGDLTFSDKSAEWGLTKASYSTGAAYGDLDNDGDLDVVISAINSPAFLYKNNTDQVTKNNFLTITLEGTKGNLSGFGTKVWIYHSDTVQYFEHTPYRGYQSTMGTGIHAGLGSQSRVDSISVLWPDGKAQVLKDVAANQFLKVRHMDSKPAARQVKKISQPYFSSANKERSVQYVHKETHYIDFKIQPLLPHKYSQNGPGVAVGDVNGDGLDDFIAGGAFKQPTHLFIQQKNGGFLTKAFEGEIKYEEDMGLLLFDADGDGDRDLYVVSGGNEFPQASLYYRDKFYVNDGKGNFALQKNMTLDTASGSCVIASDYDRDGDLDLFVGGRLNPHKYPEAGESFILQNNDGRFLDVTDVVAPGLKNAGMVTSALWTDVDNDQQIDLIVVGEWMPVTIFKNLNGKFSKGKFDVPQSRGWWNSIAGADFDRDGDTDYILGNLGLNSRFKTSSEKPVRVYSGDFNGDGAHDAILAHYIEGINRPVHPRDDILLQMSSSRKKFKNYQSYADATIEDILGDTFTQTNHAETFSTAYLENKGNDQWLLKPLPAEAQFAPVFGILTEDFTGDGFTDVVLTGNSYAPDVLTGRYDAFKGLLLSGDGNGSFKPLTFQEAGLFIDGDAKGLASLLTTDKMLILAAQNNDTLSVIENIVSNRPVFVAKDNDVFALVTGKNGSRIKYEFYYGSGYLSQSSRSLRLPADTKKVLVYNSNGESREIDY